MLNMAMIYLLTPQGLPLGNEKKICPKLLLIPWARSGKLKSGYRGDYIGELVVTQ